MNAMTPQELADTFTLDELRAAFDAMPVEAMIDRQPRQFTAGGIDGFATMADVGQAKMIHRGWVR